MKRNQRDQLLNGSFGLERETLRVDQRTCCPAVTDHPFPDDPNISVDFCEAQTEIITPVVNSTEELMAALRGLSRRVSDRIMKRGEMLFISSNPPAGYDPEKIRIAHFAGMDSVKENYRRYLKEKYGLERMLLCGIHFNYSFSETAMEVIEELTGISGDALYLKLASYSMKYAWLITFLTAASPASIRLPSGKKTAVSSVRCSSAGYWNDFIPVLNYEDLGGYCDSIDALTKDGHLYSPWELYLPVRLKPRGNNSLEGLRSGISHIELRMLDVNPLSRDGIFQEDLEFIRLLLIMWAVKEPIAFSKCEQEAAVRNMQKAALLDEDNIWIENPMGIYSPVLREALLVIADMEVFYEPWQDAGILEMIQYQKIKLLNPELRYARRVKQLCASCSESQAIIV